MNASPRRPGEFGDAPGVRRVPGRHARPGLRVVGWWPLWTLAALMAVAVLSAPRSETPPETGGGGAERAAGALPDGWTMTESGPLGPADRDLLVRVRLARLWAAPLAQQAQERASSGRVRQVGARLAADHLALDEQVRRAARRLRVELPSRPNTEQRNWMTELSGRRGAEYDRSLVTQLRAAYGDVLTSVAAVRSGTRNDTVRALAQSTLTLVMKHMSMLESSGIVDYPKPSEPPAPTQPAPAAVAVPVDRGGVAAPVGWLVLVAALVVGVLTAARAVRTR